MPSSSASSRPDLSFRNSIDGLKGVDAFNTSMADWARFLLEGPGGVDRLVLDRTGLAGRYNFHVSFEVRVPTGDPDALGRSYETVKREAMKAAGLELEEPRAPFEVLIIERAEKPSEN